jgi:hypothetical protein
VEKRGLEVRCIRGERPVCPRLSNTTRTFLTVGLTAMRTSKCQFLEVSVVEMCDSTRNQMVTSGKADEVLRPELIVDLYLRRDSDRLSHQQVRLVLPLTHGGHR